MNLATFTLMVATGGIAQPAPAPTDVRVVSKRTFSVPVETNPAKMQDVERLRLFVSRDQGATYELQQTITPQEASGTGFTFTAKEDGTYWLQMQEQRRDGTLLPKDPSSVAPSEKLVIDTVKPVVTISTAEHLGGEVVVEWKIDDKHPADATTKVFYKPLKGDDTQWKEAPAGSIRKRVARFKPEVSGSVLVQVATADLAGNIGYANREVVKALADVPSTTGIGNPLPAPSLPNGASDGAPTPPTGFGGAPAAAPFPPAGMTPESPLNAAPPAAASPPPPPSGISETGTRPIAVSTGTGSPAVAPAPAAEPPLAQYSRSPRLDLNYALDGGPSGVARIDLYVTRDDGRSWVKWSTHDGRETPLKVVLDTRFNKEVEGDYGFVLVPVSGAGLSEPAPTAGTAPETRVRVDVSPPVIKVFQPTADAANRNALLLHWEATDRNFGKEPIVIEYSEQPNGPWRAVNGADVVPVAGGGVKDIPRLENTGSYSWQPPITLATPKVYLKFTAWDLAGNRSEVITPNPILVDLTKPKARIQGISPSGGR